MMTCATSLDLTYQRAILLPLSSMGSVHAITMGLKKVTIAADAASDMFNPAYYPKLKDGEVFAVGTIDF